MKKNNLNIVKIDKSKAYLIMKKRFLLMNLF